MAEAKEGDTVQVHYTGTLGDGSQFDSSRERDPLRFTLGQGEIIPGFEKAVSGMNVGEKKDVTLPAAEAYGERREGMTTEVAREKLPENLDPKEGMTLQVQTGKDQTATVTVAEVKDESITIDANHPLAGKDLNFEIELVNIE